MACHDVDSGFGDGAPFATSYQLLGLRFVIFGCCALAFSMDASARPVEIEGVVKHSRSGEVIAGAYVVALQETLHKHRLSDNEPAQVVRTDHEGRFRFSFDLTADRVRVEVTSDLCEWNDGGWVGEAVSGREVIEIPAMSSMALYCEEIQ